MSFKKVLITGADGFSGRHLFSRLSADKSLDIYRTDRNMNGPKALNFIIGDLNNKDFVRFLLSKVCPNELYHLAGTHSNIMETDLNSNVLTSSNLLDCIIDLKLKCRILVVGSSAEYGVPKNANKGVRENHERKPISVYGLVKSFLSDLVEVYKKSHDLDIVEVRPFNLYGAGMPDTLFLGKISKEIEKVKKGEIKKIVTGDLSAKRDYIAIESAVEYYLKVMEKGVSGEVYNIGTGNAVSQRKMVRCLIKRSGVSLRSLEEKKGREECVINIPSIFADVSKINKLL